jgi:hypothetical protein
MRPNSRRLSLQARTWGLLGAKHSTSLQKDGRFFHYAVIFAGTALVMLSGWLVTVHGRRQDEIVDRMAELRKQEAEMMARFIADEVKYKTAFAQIEEQLKDAKKR